MGTQEFASAMKWVHLWSVICQTYHSLFKSLNVNQIRSIRNRNMNESELHFTWLLNFGGIRSAQKHPIFGHLE